MRFRGGLLRGVVAGGSASWLRRGTSEGLPLVVLHGAGLDRAGVSWARVLPRLAERRPVFAPDLPGHGDTATLSGFHGVGDLARWLVSFLDAVEVERAAITGVSLGGAIALRTALDAPHRVAGVVPVASYGIARRMVYHRLLHLSTRLPLARIADPLVSRSDAAARSALRVLLHDPEVITPDLVAEIRAIARSDGTRHTFDRFLANEVGPDGFRSFFIDDLRRLEVPAHFVHGIQDTVVPIDAAREAARLTGSPLTELAAGHWPMFEAPEGYLEAALPFLGELRR